MRKFWLVVKREYLTRVRTKGFILATIGLPLFSVGIFGISSSLATRKTDHPQKISIVDNLGGMAPLIWESLSDKLPDGRPRFELVRNWDRPQSEAQAHDEMTQEVRSGDLDGFLEIPADVLITRQVSFHSRNGSDFQTDRTINNAVTTAVIARRLIDRGVRIDHLNDLMRGVHLTQVKITKSGESEEGDQSILIQLSVVMILYITLMVYGVMTMRSVLEEKTTRVVEILASSARPIDLLTGKIVGVAGVAMTQYFIWGATAGLFSVYGAAASSAMWPGASPPKIHVPIAYILYAAIFFLVGYFLYASMYAAIGAMVSSEEELQQVQIPVTLILVASFILYPVIQRAPNSPLAVTLTLIPFISPILMVFRITVQTPPFWQIALSLLLCVAATVAVNYVSAKIYRVGILMHGKRPSLVELMRWLKYT